jgi:heat-inducible transcriptional repressor
MHEAQPRLLNRRAWKILEAVVKDYIQTALPVGSSRIATKYNLAMSPASVRNVMAHLEGMGLLEQPYASAGRIPTDRGLRYYVDMLVEPRPLKRREKEMIQQNYREAGGDIDGIMRETSRTLSRVTRYTSVVMAHRLAHTTFQQIAFVKLDARRILLILISSSGTVMNKIIEEGEEFTQDDLNTASNYLNTHMQGLPLVVVKNKIAQEMEAELTHYDRLRSRILSWSRTALEEELTEIYIDGQSNMLDQPEFAEDIDKMKALLRAFEEKGILIRLLDKVMEADEIQVYIGAENEYDEMNDCSLVAMCYGRLGVPVGTVAIVGPKRMNYSRVIPIVRYTAQVVENVLESI